MKRSRQVIIPNPQLKNERVLEGVRASPDFDAYERLCRGEQLPRTVCTLCCTVFSRSYNINKLWLECLFASRQSIETVLWGGGWGLNLQDLIMADQWRTKIETRCGANAGRTAPCCCKFRYVSNFTTASCGFSATARLSFWSLSADCSELSVKKWYTPSLNPSQTGRYSIYLPQRNGRLSWSI